MARVNKELKLQTLKNELEFLATTDSLTKLYNRRYFMEMSTKMIELAKREKQALSIIMLDIDDFKKVNDTYGHQIGDDVLIELANTLMSNQRKSDIICRFGGEEFEILLPNTSLSGAERMANNLRKEVASLVIDVPDDQKLQFTISLDVSQINLKTENNLEKGLKRADEALYQAKETGKNKVCTQGL